MMAEDALALLAEAFGQHSEDEIRAMLAPHVASGDAVAGAGVSGEAGWPASIAEAAQAPTRVALSAAL